MFGIALPSFDVQYVEYVACAVFLLLACFHSAVYSSVYCATMFSVVLQGEKGKAKKWTTQLVAATILFFYLAYNLIVYYVIMSTVAWQRLFTGRLFVGSVFDHKWAVFLFYEPVIQLMTSWFKIGCAMHSLFYQPTREGVSGANLLRLVKKNKSSRKSASELPEVIVVMPIYNEPLPSFMTAVNSVVDTVYPNHRMHLLLAFDEGEVTPLYRSVMHCLRNGDQIDMDALKAKSKYGLDKAYMKIAKRLAEVPESELPPASSFAAIQDVHYRGLTVSPCRFPHGGKRHAQMCAYRYLQQRIGPKSTSAPLLLFIDSDIQLDPYAINYFVSDLYQHKGRQREALTGLITCKTADTYNFWKVLQDTEYIESQMLQRTTEDYLGSVSCLPGALTMVRFRSLQAVADQYFDQMSASDSFDFARCHLGEDRYFTHLLMEKRPDQYRIGYCSAARCKTEGCESFYQLLKQRRRWYLGTLANEVHMLCSPLLWKHVPGLLVLQLFTSLKNGPLFLYVFISEQVLGRGTLLTLGLACAIFIPIWMFVASFGFKIKRKKIAWCYPFIVILLPFMAAIFQLYGIYTLRVRTWGGPRAANEKAEGTAPEANVAAAPIQSLSISVNSAEKLKERSGGAAPIREDSSKIVGTVDNKPKKIAPVELQDIRIVEDDLNNQTPLATNPLADVHHVAQRST